MKQKHTFTQYVNDSINNTLCRRNESSIVFVKDLNWHVKIETIQLRASLSTKEFINKLMCTESMH